MKMKRHLPIRSAAVMLALAAFTAGCTTSDAATLSQATARDAEQPAATRHPAASPQGATVWMAAAEGNEARYLVREQLAGRELQNDAIGRTSQVTGTIALGVAGAPMRAQSRFTIDMASLASDSDRRDNFIRRRTLETETHPTVTFVPTSFRGLPTPLPTSAAEGSFQLVGDLTIRGVTRPTTWQVSARYDGESQVTGTATTAFTFADFEITKPRVAVVLSVADTIRLEYDFTMVPAGSP